MKIVMKHVNLHSISELDSWLEGRVIPLSQKRQIDGANIELIRHPEQSPAFEARFHLITPGPDIYAQARDHTLRAACEKAWTQLQKAVDRRASKLIDRSPAHSSGSSRSGRSRFNVRNS